MNQKLKWVGVAAGFIVFVAMMVIREVTSVGYLRILSSGIAFSGIALSLVCITKNKKIFISRRQQITMIAVFAVIFGAAMGFSEDLPALWMRVSAYALGGVSLFFLMWTGQQRAVS